MVIVAFSRSFFIDSINSTLCNCTRVSVCCVSFQSLLVGLHQVPVHSGAVHRRSVSLLAGPAGVAARPTTQGAPHDRKRTQTPHLAGTVHTFHFITREKKNKRFDGTPSNC